MQNGEKINLYSIFRSINGEICKPGQGSWATFIRFSGCNLKCQWCFGVKPGRRLPRIIMANKPNKKLTEMEAGDKLMTFAEIDGDLELVETTVTEVLSREVDEWYDIKINDTLYFVTGEHPFFTNRGLIQASSLKVGDMVLHSSHTDKLSFRMLGNKNPMRDQSTVDKVVSHKDYKQMGKKVSATIKRKQKDGEYVSVFQLLSKEKQDEMRRKLSHGKLGSKNPNWNDGGETPNYSLLASLCKAEVIKSCSKCPSSRFLHVHHKDRNQQNDSFSNLEILCKSCHSKEHKTGLNFWKGERKDGKKKSVPVLNGFVVQSVRKRSRLDSPPSICPKPLKVYNLSCSPHNSYLVDYMWVHNCDTVYAQEVDPSKALTIETIMKEVEKNKCKNVTITGGEPLTQREGLRKLVRELIIRDYSVSIETNGSIPILQRTHLHDSKDLSWVVDYKLPSSGMNPLMGSVKPWFQLTDNDFIKFVIADRSDYDVALMKVQQFWSEGVKAQMVFSPILFQLDVNTLMGWMGQNEVFSIPISLQLHKCVNISEPK